MTFDKPTKTSLKLEVSRQRSHGKVEDGVVGSRDELHDDHEADKHRTGVRKAECCVKRLQGVEVSEASNLN